MPHLIEGLRHVQTNYQALSLDVDSRTPTVGLIDHKFTGLVTMAKAILAVINQMVILQIRLELAFYKALRHFWEQVVTAIV